MADEGIFTVTLANNSVLKIYSGGKTPEEVHVSFIKDEDTDAEVKYDKLLLHENLEEELKLHSGSELDITPAAGTEVFVNDRKFEKNEKGMVNLKVTEHSEIHLKKVTSGIGNIASETGNYSEDENEIYSLQGIRLGKDSSRLPAGIYIRAGKKIRLK